MTAYGRVSVGRWVESSRELPELLCDRWAEYLDEPRDYAWRGGCLVVAP